MAYKAYVTPKYYLETYRGASIPESELDLRLRDASRHIDSLTYSRIVGQGFFCINGVSAGCDPGSCMPSGRLRGGEPGGAGLRVILVLDQWRKHDADRRMECIPG